MQKSTTNHNEESSTTLNTANETHGNNSSLLERRQLPGTPFTLIKQIMDNDKPKYFIVMGDHRLTEPTENELESLDKLYKEQWKIIVNVTAIVSEKIIEQMKIENKLTGPLYRSYPIQTQTYETESL